jgi:hypothetical protein
MFLSEMLKEQRKYFFCCYLFCVFLYLTVDFNLLIFVFVWFGLGVLASIGLGCGLHTFALFVAPYILQQTLKINECNSLHVINNGTNINPNFVCYYDTTTTLKLKLQHENNIHTTSNDFTFVELMMTILPVCLIWGVGTTFGELPPYLIANAYRKLQISNNKTSKKKSCEYR